MTFPTIGPFSLLRDDRFRFGNVLADNDEHLLRQIEQGNYKKLFVSLYGDPTSAANSAIMARAESVAVARRDRSSLEAHFFDAASVAVWG